MNFLIDKNKFSEIIGNFSGVCSSAFGKVNPVLGCVKITVTDNGELVVKGTDLNTYIDITVPELKLFVPVEFCVNQNKLFSFINTLASGDITVTLKDDKNLLLIEQLKTKIEIPVTDPNQFPGCVEQVQGIKVETDTALLKEEIKKAGVCTAKYDTGNIMSGISFKCNKDKILIASTDGNFLYASGIELSEKADEFNSILPYESAKELIKSIKSKTVFITVGKNNAKISAEGINITFSLLCGIYPAYLQLIPKDYTNKITLNREIFLNSIKRCQISASEKTDDKNKGSFFVKINITKDCLELSSTVLSSVVDSFDIKTDFELKTALNPKYLTDVLNSVNTENFVMEFGDTGLQGVLIKPDSDSNDSLFLLMPIQVL